MDIPIPESCSMSLRLSTDCHEGVANFTDHLDQGTHPKAIPRKDLTHEPYIYRLPNELLEKVLANLGIRDVSKFLQVSKGLSRHQGLLNALWSNPLRLGEYPRTSKTIPRMSLEAQLLGKSLSLESGFYVKRVFIDDHPELAYVQSLELNCPNLTVLDIPIYLNVYQDTWWRDDEAAINRSPLWSRIKTVRYDLRRLSGPWPYGNPLAPEILPFLRLRILFLCPNVETLVFTDNENVEGNITHCYFPLDLYQQDLGSRLSMSRLNHLTTLRFEHAARLMPRVDFITDGLQHLKEPKTFECSFNEDMENFSGYRDDMRPHVTAAIQLEPEDIHSEPEDIQVEPEDIMDGAEGPDDADEESRLSYYLGKLKKLGDQGWTLRSLDYGRPTTWNPSRLFGIISRPDSDSLLRFWVDVIGWNPTLDWGAFYRSLEEILIDSPDDAERRFERQMEDLRQAEQVLHTLRRLGIPVRVEQKPITSSSFYLMNSIWDNIFPRPSDIDLEYAVENEKRTRTYWKLESVGELIDELTVNYTDNRSPTNHGWIGRRSPKKREAKRRAKEADRYRDRFWDEFAHTFPNVYQVKFCVPPDIYGNWSNREMVENLPGDGWEMSQSADSICRYHGTLLNIKFERKTPQFSTEMTDT